jgi:hypothetical protein
MGASTVFYQILVSTHRILTQNHVLDLIFVNYQSESVAHQHA